MAEVLAAVVVLSVALTGASFMMTSAFGTYRSQDRTLARQQLVHDQMETIAAQPYAAVKMGIVGSRRPADPLRPDFSPADDFVSVSGGESVVNYELEPPKEGEKDWTPKAKKKPGANGQFTNESKKYNPNLDATLRLQYWDPQFDTPSQLDKGLIRAKFTLSGDGVQTEAVRYVTR